ncbi:MAG: DUF1320 domain-containing protein [Magnetococcales bacterium]|nr:DUF1320 domain-containing protein [Magnetococcales bacterium]
MYTTTTEMIEAYGQETIQDLTDRADPPLGEIDHALLQRAIDAACELVDGYLTRRYALPLAQVPADLAAHVMALAFFNLHRNRRETIEAHIRQARDEAVKYLVDLGQGVIVLHAQPSAVTSSTPVSGASPLFVAPPRIFDSRTLRGF